MLLHPEAAGRSCDDCRKYLYEDHPTRMGLPVLRRDGARVERVAGQPTPCRWCPKVPRGAPAVPASAVELTARNWAAYGHYRRCRAVGRFPADALVERNAALCAQVREEAAEARDRQRHEDLAAALISALPLLRK